ncbi:MAG: hypothetical protein V3U95_00950 [Dehalococcoidia bacterium]
MRLPGARTHADSGAAHANADADSHLNFCSTNSGVADTNLNAGASKPPSG